LDDSCIPRREALDILGYSRFGLGRKWRRLDEEVVMDIIEVSKTNMFPNRQADYQIQTSFFQRCLFVTVSSDRQPKTKN
jgi:hypothetical protein